MHGSVYDIKAFYKSPRGLYVKNKLVEKFLEIWPDAKNLRVLGLGYAVPYLNLFEKESDRIFALMPTSLGVHHWPENDVGNYKNLTALADQTELPLETNSIDRILLLHGLEFSEMPKSSLQEIWRVLKSNGKAIIVIPNRRGLWAGSDTTPLGQGTPYTLKQISDFLKENFFVHERTDHALFVPPRWFSLFSKISGLIDKAGGFVMPAFAGVHIIEASKQVYAGLSAGSSYVEKPVIRGRKWVMPRPAAPGLKRKGVDFKSD